MDNNRAMLRFVEPGERVLWFGKPVVWRLVAGSFLVYVFAVPWTVFTFGWLWQVTGGLRWPKAAVGIYPAWEPFAFAGIGVVMFLAGLVMLTLPFWKWLAAKRTFYAVTDRQVLKFNVAKPESAETLSLEGPVKLQLSPEQHGIIDIEFVAGNPARTLLLKAVRKAPNVLAILRNFEEN
ncbi:MAG TPA: hypothetical protein VIT91_08610 [Chthoniobacterales bacterium]